MKLLFVVMLSAFGLFLAGCATPGDSPATEEPPAEETVEAEEEEAWEDRPPSEGLTTVASPLPAYELDGAGFYRLLMGELALLNDEPEIALYLLGEAQEQYPHEVRILQRVAPLAAQLGELEISLRYFRQWTELSPENTNAWHGVWQLALADQDPQLAVQALQALLELSPGYEFYTPFERLTEWDDDALTELYSEIDDVSGDFADNPDVQLLLGFLAELQNDLTQAETHWQVLADHLDSQADYLAYGEILTDMSASQGARKVLREGSEAHPDEPRFYLLLARSWLQDDDQQAALAALQDGLEFNPQDAGLLRFAGELAFDQGRPEAEDLFTRLLDTDDFSAGHYYLGRLAQDRNEPQEAFEHYQSITDSDWALGGLQQMIELLQASALPEVSAQDLFAEQREQFPGLVAEMSELQGRYWYEVGDYQQAFDTFSLGLRERPNSFYLLYMRALSAEPLDRLDDLEADLRLILDQDPDNTAALNALGYTLVDRTDRIEEAASMIEQAYEQNPDSYAITDSLGWLRFKQGRYEEAAEILGTALEMQGWDTDDDEIVAHYVEALWMNDQRDEARDVAERWLTRHANTERLESVLERLEQEAP